METSRLADLHAYVDDCLEPYERHAFETLMAEDPALASRAAEWRTQSSAIRSAFDGEGTRAFSISIIRHQNENLSKTRRTAAVGGRASREQQGRFAPSTASVVSRFGAAVGAPYALRSSLSWRLALAALIVTLASVWSAAEPAIPGRRLAEAGVAAFRAFARPGAAPVEFASADAGQSQAWLTARLPRPVYLPTPPASLSLIGARIAPAPGASAAFLVFKADERLVGLTVQSLDAPPRARARASLSRWPHSGGVDFGRPGVRARRRSRWTVVDEDCRRLLRRRA